LPSPFFFAAAHWRHTARKSPNEPPTFQPYTDGIFAALFRPHCSVGVPFL
jgi:hypothetical protein